MRNYLIQFSLVAGLAIVSAGKSVEAATITSANFSLAYGATTDNTGPVWTTTESGLIETRSRVGNFVKTVQQGEQIYRLAVEMRSGLDALNPATAQALASTVMQQIQEAVDRRRFSIAVLPASTEGEPFDPIDHAVANGIHGLLIYPNEQQAQIAAARRALDAGVKTSLLGQSPMWDLLDAFSIQLDDIGAARQIITKFASLGHRNVAVVFDQGWNKSFHDKYREAV